MKVLLRVQNRTVRYSGKFRAVWNRWWFLFMERPRHKKIELGQDVIFHVPVRGGGEGRLSIGQGTKFGVPFGFRLGDGGIMLQARLPEAEITIGEKNWFNNNTVLCALRSIQIGSNCQIGDNVSIFDSDFHEISPATRNRSAGRVEPVSIGNNVWIGSRVMVLKGVSIGDNSVIGAMSLVTRPVPANCIAAGVPAKLIRKIE